MALTPVANLPLIFAPEELEPHAAVAAELDCESEGYAFVVSGGDIIAYYFTVKDSSVAPWVVDWYEGVDCEHITSGIADELDRLGYSAAVAKYRRSGAICDS